MLEVEIKAALEGREAEALAQRLREMDFAEAETVREEDVYYNGADRDFRRTDEALRLRTVRNTETGESVSQITYKGPKQEARSNTREELETGVAEGETAAAILERLGCRPVWTVAKTRRAFRRGAVTVCLDRVDGLGDFLEIEQLVGDPTKRDAAVDDLLALLDQLAIPRHRLTRTTYLEMLISG